MPEYMSAGSFLIIQSHGCRVKNKGKFAMKEFHMNEEFVRSFERELNILKQLKHENIAALFGYFTLPGDVTHF